MATIDIIDIDTRPNEMDLSYEVSGLSFGSDAFVNTTIADGGDTLHEVNETVPAGVEITDTYSFDNIPEGGEIDVAVTMVLYEETTFDQEFADQAQELDIVVPGPTPEARANISDVFHDDDTIFVNWDVSNVPSGATPQANITVEDSSGNISPQESVSGTGGQAQFNHNVDPGESETFEAQMSLFEPNADTAFGTVTVDVEADGGSGDDDGTTGGGDDDGTTGGGDDGGTGSGSSDVSVSCSTPSETLESGQSFTLDIELDNSGSVDASVDADVIIGGSTVQSISGMFVPAGSTNTVSRFISTPQVDSGEQTFDVTLDYTVSSA